MEGKEKRKKKRRLEANVILSFPYEEPNLDTPECLHQSNSSFFLTLLFCQQILN